MGNPFPGVSASPLAVSRPLIVGGRETASGEVGAKRQAGRRARNASRQAGKRARNASGKLPPHARLLAHVTVLVLLAAAARARVVAADTLAAVADRLRLLLALL